MSERQWGTVREECSPGGDAWEHLSHDHARSRASLRMEWYLENRPQLAGLISNWPVRGSGDRRLLSLLRGHRMKALRKRMLDETSFLSEHGGRAVSKVHERAPFRFAAGGETYEVGYCPAGSPACT